MSSRSRVPQWLNVTVSLPELICGAALCVPETELSDSAPDILHLLFRSPLREKLRKNAYSFICASFSAFAFSGASIVRKPAWTVMKYVPTLMESVQRRNVNHREPVQWTNEKLRRFPHHKAIRNCLFLAATYKCENHVTHADHDVLW